MDAVIIWNLPLKVSLCKPTLNYLIVPLAGMADSAFLRLLPPDYFDQVSLPRGGLTSSLLPNARAVSVAVHQAHEETNHRESISQMVMQFGQFLDHDISLTPELEEHCCDTVTMTKDSQKPRAHEQ